MISQKTVAAICDDVGVVYQMTTDNTPFEKILQSEEFRRAKRMVQRDCPDLDDMDILRAMIEGYSERLRTL